MKILGLIGGITWYSTVEYYRLINEDVTARLGGLHSARCIIHSLEFADVAEMTARHDWDAVLELVGNAVSGFERSGVEGLVLCANTMHVIADRLEQRFAMPIVHIVDATAAAIRRAGIERVALLGTRYTLELDFFKDRLAWHGVTAIVPEPTDREFIHETIFSELARNDIRDPTRSRYLAIIDTMAQKHGVTGAILGCTEIPLLIKQGDASVPVFDTTVLHARAAVDFALS